MSFNGFSEEFVDLFFTLQFNNTNDLLPQNKIKYKKLITEPLLLLYNDLVPTVRSISESIIIKPSKCISSMYNDMRFSRDTPLKGYMYLRFREPFNEKDVLGFYFDMGFKHYSCGIRIYKQTSSGMEKIRKCVIENSKPFIHELEQLSGLGMHIFGESFVKDRYENINNNYVKELLNKKGFYIGCNYNISPIVFSYELALELQQTYQNLSRFYLLIKKALYF